MSFRMYVPTRIIFGTGSLNKLSRQKMPGKKALVVISNGKSTRANGYLDRTLQALEQAGYLCRLTDVIGVEIEDEVGNLHKLLSDLEESNINVDYLYLSFNRGSGKPIMVFHCEDVAEVADCLSLKGYGVL